MEKINPKVDEILDISMKGQDKLAERKYKKLTEKKKKFKLTNYEEILINTAFAYNYLNRQRFGEAENCLKKINDLSTKNLSEKIFEEKGSLYNYIFCYSDEKKIKKNFILEKEKKNWKGKKFLDLLIFEKFENSEFSNLSKIVAKIYKNDKDNKNGIVGSFFIKLYDQISKIKKFENLRRLEPFLFLVKNDEEKNNKMLIMNYNIFLMAANKNKEFLSLANKNYLDYIIIYKNLLEKKNIVKNLENLKNKDYKYFLLLNFLLRNFNKFSFDKNDIEKIYIKFFLESLIIKNEKEIEMKIPDWENLLLFINYFAEKSEKQNCGEIDDFLKSEVNLKNLYDILLTNINLLQEKKSKLYKKNFILGIFRIYELADDFKNSKLDDILKIYCNQFQNSYYFFNEFKKIIKNEKFQNLIYKNFVNKPKLGYFEELNLFYMEDHLKKNNLNKIQKVNFCLKKYTEMYKSEFKPEKGQRRDEDAWLLCAVEILKEITKTLKNGKNDQNSEIISKLALICPKALNLEILRLVENFLLQILKTGRKLSPYNFNITLELIRINKKLGFFSENEKIFIKEDLKGNQHETLGNFFFNERLNLRLFNEENEIIVKSNLDWYCENKNGISKNIKSILNEGNLEFFNELDIYYKLYYKSYWKLILIWKNQEKYLIKILKNFSEKDFDNFLYAENFFENFDDFCYLNTDFILDDFCGIFLNRDYVKFSFGLNNLIGKYFFFTNKKKIGEEEKKILLKKCENLKNIFESVFLERDYKDDFKVIRNHVKNEEIDIFFKNQSKKINKKFQNEKFKKIILNYKQILDIITNSLSNKKIDIEKLENILKNLDNFEKFDFENLFIITSNYHFLYILYFICKNIKKNFEKNFSNQFLEKIKKKSCLILKIFKNYEFNEKNWEFENVNNLFTNGFEKFFVENNFKEDLERQFKDSFVAIKIYLMNNYKF